MSKRRAEFSIDEKDEDVKEELPPIGKINTAEEIAQRKILRVKAPQYRNQSSGTTLIINAPPPSFAPTPESEIKKSNIVVPNETNKPSQSIKQSEPIVTVESMKPVGSTEPAETSIDNVKLSEPNTPSIQVRVADSVKDFNPIPNNEPVETTNPNPPERVQQGNPFMLTNAYTNLHPYVHDPIRHINPYGQSYGLNPFMLNQAQMYNNPFASNDNNNPFAPNNSAQPTNPLNLLTPEDIAKLAEEEEPTEPPKQKKVKKEIDFGPDFVPLDQVKFWEEEDFMAKFKDVEKVPLPKREPFDTPRSPGYYERFWSKPFEPIFKSAFFKKPEHKFFANMNPPSFGVNPDYPTEVQQMLKRTQSMPLPIPLSFQQPNFVPQPYIPQPPQPPKPQQGENTALLELLKQLRALPKTEQKPRFNADGSPYKPLVRLPTQEELEEERARRRNKE